MALKLDAKIPAGALAEKWSNHKTAIKVVSPANKRKLDIIIVGTGLGGASAAASLGELGYNVKVFCIQDSPRRAHSIAAQGGINAAKNYQNDNDSVYRLFYDTIKGGDYRAREANVYRLAEVSNLIIDQCVGQGVPFAREYGGLLANEILKQYDLSVADRITIVSAISNHDESTGGAVDPISAALIIGDKTDVRRSRVREKPKASFDIHDRVNYAVTDQTLKINIDKKVISLNLQIDTKICTMYEYFEIFLGRMMMCRGAADVLGMTFKLTANGSKVLYLSVNHVVSTLYYMVFYCEICWVCNCENVKLHKTKCIKCKIKIQKYTKLK